MAAFKNAPDDPVHTIATEIISTILGAKTHFLLRTVENALEKICTFSGAEKVRLFSISEGKQYVTILHQWPANPNNNPAEFSVETLEEYLGFCFEDLLEKNTVVLSDPFQNTQFSNPDVRQSTNLQPRTALIFPIASSTGVHGAIVIYGNSGQKIEWSDVIYELLEEISDSLLNATIRLRNEKLKQGSAELEFWKKFQILLDLSEIYSFQLTVSLDKTVSLDFISNNLSSITGHPREKIQTFDSLLKFFNLEYTENLQIILDRLIEKTGIERIVCKSRRHDTVPRWIEITAKSEFNPEKQRITSIYGVVKDISKYKLTEEALQKTNDDLTLAKIDQSIMKLFTGLCTTALLY
ncbi:MAG: GAF domain-containing protein [Fibrobacter sp.]|nr:GAF domain-containing protein [Fibrobacter sp.]